MDRFFLGMIHVAPPGSCARIMGGREWQAVSSPSSVRSKPPFRGWKGCQDHSSILLSDKLTVLSVGKLCQEPKNQEQIKNKLVNLGWADGGG